MSNVMTEESALTKSTNWADKNKGYFGYLPFEAANFLVGTGKYEFHQVCCWGYIVRQRDLEAHRSDKR